MNEEKARKILGEDIELDGTLHCLGPYIRWEVGDESITLDGEFTVEELKAIIWWMEK